MITIEGIIQRSGMGTGIWALVTADGVTYEILQDAPKDLLQPNLKVCVKGQVREDIMTVAMIGPVLEVKSFELVKP